MKVSFHFLFGSWGLSQELSQEPNRTRNRKPSVKGGLMGESERVWTQHPSRIWHRSPFYPFHVCFHHHYSNDMYTSHFQILSTSFIPCYACPHRSHTCRRPADTPVRQAAQLVSSSFLLKILIMHGGLMFGNSLSWLLLICTFAWQISATWHPYSHPFHVQLMDLISVELWPFMLNQTNRKITKLTNYSAFNFILNKNKYFIYNKI